MSEDAGPPLVEFEELTCHGGPEHGRRMRCPLTGQIIAYGIPDPTQGGMVQQVLHHPALRWIGNAVGNDLTS